MTFFGRNAELEKLALFFDRAPQSLALVYGRRGVGKTRLICEALSLAKCRYMFFSCRQTNETDNTEQLCAAIHE